MIDGVPKGNGDSRYLKSSVSANITFAEFITMLRNGTFPIDLNGINSDGWTQIGTALNRANLLSSSVSSAIFGDTNDHTVSEAIGKAAGPRDITTTLLDVTTTSDMTYDTSHTYSLNDDLYNYRDLIFTIKPALAYHIPSSCINFGSTINASDNYVFEIGYYRSNTTKGSSTSIAYLHNIQQQYCTELRAGSADIGGTKRLESVSYIHPDALITGSINKLTIYVKDDGYGDELLSGTNFKLLGVK